MPNIFLVRYKFLPYFRQVRLKKTRRYRKDLKTGMLNVMRREAVKPSRRRKVLKMMRNLQKSEFEIFYKVLFVILLKKEKVVIHEQCRLIKINK